MAADVQRRGHGRSLEGLSVIAGAAHLLPPDAAAKNNAQAATLRASYQRYVGVSSAAGESTAAGQLPFHMQRTDSYGPKLVQGDYTYTTARKTLTLSSLSVGGGPLPPHNPNPAIPPPRGSIPAMVPSKASATNTAAWKAYGSPNARTQHNRPPLASATYGNNANALQPLIAPSKLPRVAGFKPRRPASAPIGNSEELIRPVVAAINSTSSFSSVNKRLAATVATAAAPTMVDVGVLAVDLPDPLMIGKTDTGRVMFEHTLPTDPYSKMVWEEQARKARANIARHAAAMAAAASVNGGMSHSSSGSVAGSRPASAMRGTASLTDGGSSTGSGGGGRGSGATATRPRFSSLTLGDLARQGADHRPPTVVGFAAPDLTEDTTMPGPGDPRWAYTRLGRTQIERLQNSLKYSVPQPAPRPTSAPAMGGVAGGTDAATAGASPRREASQPAPATGEHFTGVGETATGSSSGIRAVDLEQQRSVQLPLTASGGGGQTRPGSAGMARPGSAGFARPGSGKRPGSAGMPRPGSAGGNAVLALETSSGVPPVGGVRGASAGRTREAAPNPRVDLRAYLAEAAAEAEEDDDGTEMLLQLGDMSEEAAAAAFLLEGMDGAAGQSLPVPPDQLAARLAEMVAAVAVVAAQQQHQQQEGDGGLLVGVSMGGTAPGRPPPVVIEEMVDVGMDAMAAEVTNTAEAAVEQPQVVDIQIGTDLQGLRARVGPDAHTDDALAALHGASDFGRGAGRYGSLLSPEYANRASVQSIPPHDTDDSEASGAEDGGLETEQEPLGLGLGLGLASRMGRGARPTSARPTSARPMSVRPGSALPGSRGRSDSLAREGGLGGLEGGMDVIMEQSEGGAGED